MEVETAFCIESLIQPAQEFAINSYGWSEGSEDLIIQEITEDHWIQQAPKTTHLSLPSIASKEENRFEMSNRIVKFFPRLIHKSITSVSIVACSLKDIFRKDLLYLDDLNHLDLSFNKLKSLPDDLFIDMRNLQEIKFNSNLLESFSSKLLAPIKCGLQFADFRDNLKINAYFVEETKNKKRKLASANRSTIKDLMTLIDEECSEPIMETDKLLKSLFDHVTTGNTFEFVTRFDSTEVRKIILSGLSSYSSTRSFYEAQSNEVSIEDFCCWAHLNLFRFFYTGNPETCEKAVELHALATRFNIPEAQRLSEAIIGENVNDSNVQEILVLGDRYSYNLKLSAFQHIERMFPELHLDRLFQDPDSLKTLLSIKRVFDVVDQPKKAERNRKSLHLIPTVYLQVLKTDDDCESLKVLKTSEENVGNEECIYIGNSRLEKFPRRLNKIFANMTILHISFCQLKEISARDLIGLEHLENFDLSVNKLESLPDNLFIHMKKLRRVDFSHNELSYLSSELLIPIKNTLEFASFEENPKIDASYDKSGREPKISFKKRIEDDGFFEIQQSDKFCDRLEDLMKIIDRKCLPHITKLNPEKRRIDYDFVLKCAGRGFQVRKADLDAESPMFEAFSKSDYFDSETNQLEMNEFSAEVIEDLALYLNTGVVHYNGNFTNLFELAEVYNIPGLTSACVGVIIENIDKFDTFEILRLGHRLMSYELERLAFMKIESMLPLEKLDEKFMNDPEGLSQLLNFKGQFDNIMRRYWK